MSLRAEGCNSSRDEAQNTKVIYSAWGWKKWDKGYVCYFFPLAAGVLKFTIVKNKKQKKKCSRAFKTCADVSDIQTQQSIKEKKSRLVICI